MVLTQKEAAWTRSCSDALTPFERDVARYFDDGKSNDEIAQLTSKCRATVDRAVKMIDNRLDAGAVNRDIKASQDLAEKIRRFQPHISFPLPVK